MSKIPSFRLTIRIPWPEGPHKEDNVNIFTKIKEMFSWNRLLPFLKVIFRGILLLLVEGLKDLAIEAAKEVATKGLPDDESKRRAFAEIMKQKAISKGKELGDFELNLLRELAIGYWKQVDK
jgi:hypothetical protein